MEIGLGAELFPEPTLPPNYQLLSWREGLLEAHAEAKYRSFCLEIDANVFPCLGDREGCRRLMREISNRGNFLSGATWLLVHQGPADTLPEYCGTIQGILDRSMGAVQNLGVTPNHRGLGLGTLLLHRALTAFQEHGNRRAYLEVTAQNIGAVRLYQRLGFLKVKTVYKAADVAYA
jgi:hypothetical protein